MVNPVMAADGLLYEQCDIEEWFKYQQTSPKTNHQLETKVLIPALNIRKTIEKCVEEQKLSPALLASYQKRKEKFELLATQEVLRNGSDDAKEQADSDGSFRKLRRHLEAAVQDDQGDSAKMKSLLAQMYARGSGGEEGNRIPDLGKACQLYKEAADAGDEFSRLKLAGLERALA